jgi:ribonuclease P protein component
MRRDQRLRRGVDFERVRANGKSWAHPLIVCYERAREDAAPARVGIVVGRRVGKAATRNRVKRRLREAARSIYPQLESGYDLIVIARQPAADAHLAQLHAALLSVLPRTHVGRRLRATPLAARRASSTPTDEAPV